MSERGGRRGGADAPFYAPPRRKTSAEIISEARAALYGDVSSASSGASGSGALRPLRTRRPFTPRDPQRTLFSDRERRKDPRPPSAFNLKYLSLAESGEDAKILALGTRVASLDEENIRGVLVTEPQSNASRKKLTHRSQSRPQQDRPSEGWAGLPKLPHLSGRSKPLHRRNTTGADDSKSETDLAQTIIVTQPPGFSTMDGGGEYASKSPSPDSGTTKRKHLPRSQSYEATDRGDISVKHLAVQLPNTSSLDRLESLSVLELAEALSKRSRDVDRTLLLMETLQQVVETNQPANSLRELALRSLYTHIDSDDERILVAIARAMLTLRVTGAHLAAACKLVFKVARNDKNDHFFRTTNLLELLVEGCGRADPVSEGECCVYGAGALRFLALEPRLRALAHKAGALHLAALHLKILNTAVQPVQHTIDRLIKLTYQKAESPRNVSEQSTHALYQLTGALRNLAGGGGKEPKAFVASGALQELLLALQLHHTDRDVTTNVVRCLSVLSADESCCAWLCASSFSARALLSALAACASRASLAVRLAYTLGNMAAADEHARLNIYNEEGGIDVLLTIMESYTKRNDRDTRDLNADPDLHLIGSDLGGSDGSNEDVLIKAVRVVANLCLAERVGRGLADTHAERIVRALLACLQLAKKTADTTAETDLEEDGDSTGEDRREELATAALATLNNVTFYKEPPAPPDPLATLLENLCRVTCNWLTETGAASCEAVRALGNLSRCPRLAQLIVLEGALDTLSTFLNDKEESVRCAAAGVLVNVCGAGCSAEAAQVATHALASAAGNSDTASAALLARALWNAQAHHPLTNADACRAVTALDMFIDDESVFAACDALRASERRASDPELSKHHVKFELENNNHVDQNLVTTKPIFKSSSVDQELHLECSDEDADRTGCSGEDLGFEEGEMFEDCSCECEPCRRLASWEELVGVAIPLLDKLRPGRADASVGTD